MTEKSETDRGDLVRLCQG